MVLNERHCGLPISHGYWEKMIKFVYLLNLNFLGLVLSVLNHLNNLNYKQLLRVTPGCAAIDVVMWTTLLKI